MIRNTLSHLLLPVIATAALMVQAGPVEAQHGGHGGGGHGGGFHGGGYHGGGYHGGGYHYGNHPYSGYHAYHPDYHGYHVHPYYGSGYYPYYSGGWAYPYYDSGYEPYYSGTGYDPYYSAYSPLGSDAVIVPTTSSAQAPDTGSASPLITATPSGAPASAGGPAQITVRLPAGADLWFEGTKMSATGPVREFSTPPLTPGQRYTYSIRARWNEGETAIDQTRKAVFTAGGKLDVSFPVPEGTGEKAKGPSTPEGGR
jgi:uncharacterized protein (TIGR03000 family)